MPSSGAPVVDPSVAELDPALRARLGDHWRSRARSELEVGIAFSAMLPRLAASGAPDVVLRDLAASADDERRHAAICMQNACIYAGRELPGPGEVAAPLPLFGAGDPALEDALLVTGMCCLNETVATAWLGACLEASTAPLAVETNRAHLADEIRHARLGWAYLASLPASRKDALAAWLPALLEANAPRWLDDPTPACPAHGHLGPERTREVVLAAVRELVIPGFEHVGVASDPAVRWLAGR